MKSSLICALSIGVGIPTVAQPFTTLQADASAGANGDSGYQTARLIYPLTSSPGSQSSKGWTNVPPTGASGAAVFHQANADFGALSLYAEGIAMMGGFQVSAQAGFTDLIQISSTTLLQGTPVLVRLTTVLTGVASQIGPGDFVATGRLDGSLGLDSFTINFVQFGPPVSSVTDLTLQVGVQYNLSATLSGLLSGSTAPPFLDQSISGYLDMGDGAKNPGDAARLFLDPVSGGIQLTSASGHDYATAVPEAAAPLLFLTGLASLVTIQRRNRRVTLSTPQ